MSKKADSREWVATDTWLGEREGAEMLYEAGGVYATKPRFKFGDAARPLEPGEHIATCPRCCRRMEDADGGMRVTNKVRPRALAKGPTPSSANPRIGLVKEVASGELLAPRDAGDSRLVAASSASVTPSPENPAAVDVFKSKLSATLGCKTSETALGLLDQIVKLDHPTTTSNPDRTNTVLMNAIAQLAELQPVTATQAMLAAQMVGTQRLAMRFLAAATIDGLADDAVDRNVARATRLMQLFCGQVDTMSKLKGKGVQQRVVVEHVTVAAGGQAIVGAVVAGGREPGGVGR